MTENIERINRAVRFRRKYTAKEFFEFTKDKDEQYELINGRIYKTHAPLMASPTVRHQRIIRKLIALLSNYLEGKTCEVFVAPLDVVLFKKNKEKDDAKNVFQPDIFVVCDPNKISENRINGAPDFVIEVASRSTTGVDCGTKLNVYMTFGVREYWIISPESKCVLVYTKQKDGIIKFDSYSFDDKIKVSIFDDLEIDLKQLNL